MTEEIHFGSNKSLTFILLLRHKQACVSQFFSQVFWKHRRVSSLLSVEQYPSKGFSCHMTSFLRCVIRWIGMPRGVFWFCICVIYSFYFHITWEHSKDMVISIIECSVQWMWHGTVQSFHWTGFLLTDLNPPVFSGREFSCDGDKKTVAGQPLSSSCHHM